MKSSLFFTSDRLAEIYTNATEVISQLSKVVQLLALIAANAGEEVDDSDAADIQSYLDGADYKWVTLLDEATSQPLYLYMQKASANSAYTAMRLRNHRGDSAYLTTISTKSYKINSVDQLITVGDHEVDLICVLNAYKDKFSFYNSILQFCEVLYKGEVDASVVYSIFSNSNSQGGSYSLLADEIVKAYNVSGPQGVLFIITDLLSKFENAIIDEDTEVITPPNNDYRVLAVAPFALFTEAIPEVAGIIGNVVAWCISPVLGVVASLTAGLFTTFKDVVSNATTSSVLNMGSIDCTYAPFIRFDDVDVSPVYSRFDDKIDLTGVVEVICPQYTLRIYKSNRTPFSVESAKYTVDVAIRLQYPWMSDLSLTKYDSPTTSKFSRELVVANDIGVDSTGPTDDPAYFDSDTNRRISLYRSIMFLLLVVITGGTMRKGTYYIKGDSYTGEDLDLDVTKFQAVIDWLFQVYSGDTSSSASWPNLVNNIMTDGDGALSLPGLYTFHEGRFPVFTLVQGANTYIQQPSVVQSLVDYALSHGTGHFNAVGGVPVPLVIPPEYDKTSLITAAATSVISTAVLTGVAFKAVRGIKNIAVKWHARSYNAVSKARAELLANPTLANANAYNNAIMKYNLTGKLGGWPMYAATSQDILTGANTGAISGNIRNGTLIAGIQQNTDEQNELLRSVDTEISEQGQAIINISKLIK